jgi:hypothetical protein
MESGWYIKHCKQGLERKNCVIPKITYNLKLFFTYISIKKGFPYGKPFFVVFLLKYFYLHSKKIVFCEDASS